MIPSEVGPPPAVNLTHHHLSDDEGVGLYTSTAEPKALSRSAAMERQASEPAHQFVANEREERRQERDPEESAVGSRIWMRCMTPVRLIPTRWSQGASTSRHTPPG